MQKHYSNDLNCVLEIEDKNNFQKSMQMNPKPNWQENDFDIQQLSL